MDQGFSSGLFNFLCGVCSLIQFESVLHDEWEILMLQIFDKNLRMSFKFQSQSVGQGANNQSDQVRNVGSWSFHENLLYIVFLQRNKIIMQSKRKRRNERVFDLMSNFVVSRSSLQCRSHHQKFLEKLGDVKAIINNFKKYLSKEEFRERYLQAVGKRKQAQKRFQQDSEIKVEEFPLSEDAVEPQLIKNAQQQEKKEVLIKIQMEGHGKAENELVGKRNYQNMTETERIIGLQIFKGLEFPFERMGLDPPFCPYPWMMMGQPFVPYPLLGPYYLSSMPYQ